MWWKWLLIGLGVWFGLGVLICVAWVAIKEWEGRR